MVKMIDESKLDISKLRQLKESLDVLTAKSLELRPILQGLTTLLGPGLRLGNALREDQMKYRTEGGVGMLEIEFARLEAALLDTRRRIKPALKTLKKSLY